MHGAPSPPAPLPEGEGRKGGAWGLVMELDGESGY